MPAHSRPSANPAAGSSLSPGHADGHVIALAGVSFVADPAGALFWPDEKLLAVADLHLEKGSAFAARGVLLPPYDTAATLARLGRLTERYAPRLVIALGDSFHDGGGPARMHDISRVALKALQRGRDWLWIAGNHDPDRYDAIGGRFADILALGPLTFRHQPLPQPSDGEIAGHLHPVARVARRGRAVSRRCFAGDARRLVMPAFGAYAGGLNIRDRAIVSVFGALSFTVHMLGTGRLYAVPATRCLAD
ncbi:MAG: ligase-associated DNA damage response endonuclease PdeM [Xanthobacteraceae bacterium]